MFDSLDYFNFLPLLVAAGAAPFLVRRGRTPLSGIFSRIVESHVSERTRELETLHENQRRMLLELSHNIQTPLSVLKGRIERFERNMLHDGPPEGTAGSLSQSVDSLSSFINELLSLAYLDHSLRHEEHKPFSLSILLADVCEDIQVIAQPRDIRVTGAICPGITFFGNEKRMREAVMNLVSNAIKYMGDGPTRRVLISLRSEGGQFLIEVTDTGRGIPEHELSRIFERFYRGRAVGTVEYGTIPGTGLGLSIVERIIKEHGGAITVTSEVGKGSTFTLVLPNSLAHTRARSQRNRS